MRAVVQRVSEARVEVEGQVVGRTGPGLMVLLGVGRDDRLSEAQWLADKVAGLRIFSDEQDRMNLSVLDTKGSVLVVSQFTLWGDCKKGKRPSYVRAASGEQAEPLYEAFCGRLRELNLEVATGSFGAKMQVHLVNDGPVTLLVDSEKAF